LPTLGRPTIAMTGFTPVRARRRVCRETRVRPRGEPMHDDRMMSLALAVWDIPVRPVTRAGMQHVFESQGVKPMYDEWGL